MILNPGNVYRESTHNIYCYRGGNPLLFHTSGYHLPSSWGLSTPSPYSIRVTIDNSTDTTHSYPHNPSPSSLASCDYTLKVRAIWLTHLAPLTISSHSSSRLFVQNIRWRQFVALSLIHVYIVVGCTKRGGVSMCHYHWYRYILSPATVYADGDICWRQFVQHVLSSATIYAGDNICRNNQGQGEWPQSSSTLCMLSKGSSNLQVLNIMLFQAKVNWKFCIFCQSDKL